MQSILIAGSVREGGGGGGGGTEAYLSDLLLLDIPF